MSILSPQDSIPMKEKVFTHTPRRPQKPSHGDKTRGPEKEKGVLERIEGEKRRDCPERAGYSEEEESKQGW